MLLVGDSTVSFRHCVLTQHPTGRCTVRDVSRNGIRVDGRRLGEMQAKGFDRPDRVYALVGPHTWTDAPTPRV
jgi:hypothetical protein